MISCRAGSPIPSALPGQPIHNAAAALQNRVHGGGQAARTQFRAPARGGLLQFDREAVGNHHQAARHLFPYFRYCLEYQASSSYSIIAGWRVKANLELTASIRGPDNAMRRPLVPAHRRLRADRRLPHRGPGVQMRIHRLAMPAAFRFRGLLCRPARILEKRPLDHRSRRARAPRTAALPPGHADSRNRI